jgi:hypothetical protein
MSDQSSGAPASGSTPPQTPVTSSGTSQMAGNAPIPESKAAANQPITQQRSGFRNNWPAWAKQLPSFRGPTPNPDFELIRKQDLEQMMAGVDPAAKAEIQKDMDFLNQELLRFFKDRDYEAAVNQNAYRLFQILFIVLATLATLIGSFQALSLTNKPEWVPFFAFVETLIALLATFLATISGREPPMPRWLTNRRRAESLRREYFRYLIGVPPYDAVRGYAKRTLLSQRAADINRGVFPDETTNN